MRAAGRGSVGGSRGGPGLRDAAPRPASGPRRGEAEGRRRGRAAGAARGPPAGYGRGGEGAGRGDYLGAAEPPPRSRASSGRWRPPPGPPHRPAAAPPRRAGPPNRRRALGRSDGRPGQPDGSISQLGPPPFPPLGSHSTAPPGRGGRGPAERSSLCPQGLLRGGASHAKRLPAGPMGARQGVPLRQYAGSRGGATRLLQWPAGRGLAPPLISTNQIGWAGPPAPNRSLRSGIQTDRWERGRWRRTGRHGTGERRRRGPALPCPAVAARHVGQQLHLRGPVRGRAVLPLLPAGAELAGDEGRAAGGHRHRPLLHRHPALGVSAGPRGGAAGPHRPRGPSGGAGRQPRGAARPARASQPDEAARPPPAGRLPGDRPQNLPAPKPDSTGPSISSPARLPFTPGEATASARRASASKSKI